MLGFVSRAFTKENDDAGEPILGRTVARLAPGERRFVTPEGHGALAAEYERLRAAGEPGSPRVQALAALLEGLTVVQAAGPAEKRAVFGSWVTVEDDEGAAARYRLVGPDEADAKSGLISIDSPLGRAVLGKIAGDTVEFDRPRGSAELSIIAVEN
jgi:transcription elongation factor GreB